MNFQPQARKTIRSASHWMLAVTAVTVIGGLLLLYRVRQDPLPSLVGASMSGWLAYTLGRAAYAFSRPPTVANLQGGLLALRSFFRGTVASLGLAIAVGAVPTPMSCDFELDLQEPEAGNADEQDGMRREWLGGPLERELTEILVAGLSWCTNRESDECRERSEAAGAAAPPVHSMPERFAYAHPKVACQRGSFAQLEFEYAYLNEDGSKIQRQGDSVGSFLRADTGKWFVLSVDDRGKHPKDCEALPYHDASYAREEVTSSRIDWDTTGAQDFLDLSMLWDFSCVIERIEIVADPEEPPTILEPECWFEEGFPVESPEVSRVVVEEPRPSEVSVRVVFVGDVRSARTTVKNPRKPSLDE